MKKYEFIGLLMAIMIVIVTYLFNIFFDKVDYIVNPKYVSAQDYNTNINSNISNVKANIYKPLVVTTSRDGYYRYEMVDIYADYKDLNNETIYSR